MPVYHQMKRLPPDKRNKLIGVSLGTTILIGLIYFFLISPEQEESQNLAKTVKSARERLEVVKKTIREAKSNASAATTVVTALSRAEEDVATGDLFAWTYDTIRRFKVGYRVEIPDINRPAQGDADIIPSSGYKQVRVKIRGSGYYHDIGKFISDMENKFPHTRVENLNLEPDAGPDGSPEKLTFYFDFVALVKTTS
jgi:Tfp pilus assembly protein PilO